ncbi:hypothetical protein [Anaerotignum sp. MB30-C6]|uniref:hypothetical protein n=1 Tax=Anaerotignum sp. MB30-C6 TaxID=3070814 RepID=UPI0027DAF89A|nr:hypothetical protein [Anaerotignum sp. MB30-C6]WMI81379.1 hypothetical protein RBQ60_01210 [Anaerotignum sp. MB30-C6]
MFLSKRRRKMFVGCMVLPWLGFLLPWFSFNPEVTGYVWGYYVSPYVGLQAAIVLGLCYNAPTKEPSKWFFPVFIEILLLSIPVMYIWKMMWWYYPAVVSDNYFVTGLSTTYPPFWIAFGLTFIPIFAFPILWRRERAEMQ